MSYNTIKNILPHFRFKGSYRSAQELTSGNVNNTYLLEFQDGDAIKLYTLQHINTYVFKNPHEVMRNIALVTEHLRRNILLSHEPADRRVLELIRTQAGEYLYEDQQKGFWRAYKFINDASALDMVDCLEQMEEVGRGFGSFQRHLHDFPAEELYPSIPDFHHTLKRFYAFVRAVDLDKGGRVRQLEEEIEFFFERRRMMSSIVRMLDSNQLPLRVTHNDTKANNVLLDNKTGKAVCVIDLDTVMPGSVLYDYGDAVRFAASTASEDEPDVSKIALDMEKAEAFTRGFIAETNGFITEQELHMLPLGIKVLTCELAMRFLTDYIDGDLYFKVNAPDHNLRRARAQIALLKDIERKEEQLQAMIDSYIG